MARAFRAIDGNNFDAGAYRTTDGAGENTGNRYHKTPAFNLRNLRNLCYSPSFFLSGEEMQWNKDYADFAD